MRIHFEHKSTVFEFELPPMEQERFNALCKLAGFAIYGGAVVALVHMIDVWGLIWSLAGLALVWLCKLYKEDF